MRTHSLLAVALGVVCASACLVPTFDVGPATNANGGSGADGATGGVASAGKTSVSGGAGGTKVNAGGTGGTGGTTGPSQAGAGGETALGDAGAGGESAAGGASGGGLRPVRVGFSVFHDSAAGNDNASSSLADATFPLPPATSAGDFMLVFFGSDHSLQNLSQQHLNLLGWTLHEDKHDWGGDGQATYLLYKIATGTEPANIVIPGINTAGSGNGVQGLLSVYRGVDKAAPINAYKAVLVDTGSDLSTHVDTPTPAITTTIDNCLLIAGLSPDTAVDAPTISSWPAGFDKNLTSVINPTNPNPYGWANIYTAERVLPQAGTVAASSFGWDMTYGGQNYYGAMTFVLALAPGL